MILYNVDSSSSLKHLGKILKEGNYGTLPAWKIILKQLIQEPMFWYALFLVVSSIIFLMTLA